MIAKISSTANLGGALGYNFKKVRQEEATVLLANGLYQNQDGKYSMEQVLSDMRQSYPRISAGQRIRCSTVPSIRTRTRNFLMKGSCRLRRSIWRHLAMASNPISSLSIMTLPVSIFTSFRFEWIAKGRKINDKYEGRRSKKILMFWKRNITSFQVQRLVRSRQQKRQKLMQRKGMSRSRYLTPSVRF